MTIRPTDQPRPPVWIPVLLALVTLVAYGGLIGAEFSYFDDYYNLFNNPRMNPPTWETIRHYWTHAEQGLYIPLTYTVWAVLALIGRVSPDPMGIALNPWIFHFANVAIHVMSVLGVYAILLRLIEDRRAACIGAMLFALHPVQVEAVGWVAGMKDVMAGMLGIGAVWLYVEWRKQQWKSIHDSYFVLSPSAIGLLHVGAIVLFVLAMLAKPSALVVPVILGVIDVGMLGRSVRDAVKALWPWVVLSILCALVGRFAQDVTHVPAAPIWARPMIALDALAFYLYKLVFPIWVGLDYGRKPAYVMSQWWFWVTWLVPVAAGIALWMNRMRWRAVGVGGVIFVIAVGPVLGLATFLYQYRSTTADHYLYLAMLGPALALAWVVKHAKPRAVLAGAVVVLFILGGLTARQTRVWADDLNLFSHTLKVNPKSVMAMHNLAYAHTIRGRPQVAVPLLEQAIAGDPTYAESYEYLASVLRGLGRREEAIGYRLKALELTEARPVRLQEHLTAYYISVGRDLYDMERFGEAREMFQKALARDPGHAEAQSGLKMVQEKLGPATTTAAG